MARSRVIAEAGAVSAGAELANIAVPDTGAGRPATARLYHASSLFEDVAQRYAVIPLDDSTRWARCSDPGVRRMKSG